MSRTAAVANPALSLRRQAATSYGVLRGAATSECAPRRDLARAAAFIAQRERWLLSPRRLGRRVDEIPIRNPVFLLGVQGGGLTLIGRALHRHPAAVTVGGGPDAWTANDELGHVISRMRRLPQSLWGCKFRDDIRHPLLGAHHSNAYATSSLLPLYRRTSADATEHDARALERLIREHIAVYANDRSNARFIDKTQTNTVRVSYLAELLADYSPRFVLVVRDPYAMAYRSVREQPPAFVGTPPYEQRLRLMAEHWAGSHRCALDDLEEVEYSLVVRFEDFCAEPEWHLRAICDLIDVDFRRDMLPQRHHRLPFATAPGDDKWYPIREDRWRSRVGDRDAAIVAESCGELAERFGYVSAEA